MEAGQAIEPLLVEWLRDTPVDSGHWRDLPTFTVRAGPVEETRSPRGQDKVQHALAALGQRRVQVDECSDTLRRCVGDAADHHATIAVTDENNLRKLLMAQHLEDVLYMRLQANVRAKKVSTFPKASQGRCEHIVPRGA
jgi:hypothetical protein